MLDQTPFWTRKHQNDWNRGHDFRAQSRWLGRIYHWLRLDVRHKGVDTMVTDIASSNFFSAKALLPSALSASAIVLIVCLQISMSSSGTAMRNFIHNHQWRKIELFRKSTVFSALTESCQRGISADIRPRQARKPSRDKISLLCTIFIKYQG